MTTNSSPARAPRWSFLLWGGVWLALGWLAAMAWQAQTSTERASEPVIAAPAVVAGAPVRPPFEDMQAAIERNAMVSMPQWQSWLDQSERTLNAARAWPGGSYPLKELESNVQQLLPHLRQQSQAAGREPQRVWVLLRLSRVNPQLRLFEIERQDADRGSVDLSKLLLRLFAVSLTGEQVDPGWQAYEASCPVWGELSVALDQLRAEAQAGKGRRSELARRSLSLFDKPDLTAFIAEHARQCVSVAQSRQALLTLARVLRQASWTELFPAAIAQSPPAPVAAVDPSRSLFERQWLPVPAAVGGLCALLLVWTSRMRHAQWRQAWQAAEREQDRLREQIDRLRARLESQVSEPGLLVAQDAQTLRQADGGQAANLGAVADGLTPVTANLPDHAAPEFVRPPQTPLAQPSDRQVQLDAVRQQVRQAQLALIHRRDADQVLVELDQAQAMMDQILGQSPDERPQQ